MAMWQNREPKFGSLIGNERLIELSKKFGLQATQSFLS